MITIVVHGVPVAQGSKRIGRHGPHPVILDSNDTKLKPWREAVKWAATLAIDYRRVGGLVTWQPFTGPVKFSATFTFPRPKAHYRTGRNAHLLRDDAPTHKISKPDVDKLLRSTWDALTDAGIWRDDAQVARIGEVVKVYGDHPQAVLVIEALADTRAVPAALDVLPKVGVT